MFKRKNSDWKVYVVEYLEPIDGYKRILIESVGADIAVSKAKKQRPDGRDYAVVEIRDSGESDTSCKNKGGSVSREQERECDCDELCESEWVDKG